MRNIGVGLFCLVLCLLLSGAASAKDIYVSIETGSNSNPGTKDAPQKLLWKVMKNLADGDQVHVAEGWYMGQSKSGKMPKCENSNVTIEGGWNKDFSERNPFKYFTMIAPPADRQGAGGEIFAWESPTGKIDNVTIDGFLIDRGGHNYYFADGEPGARKRIEGHFDNSCWGYRSMNKGKSGSDPTIELIGRGSFTVRNCVLLNNAWWGIYIKAGGTGAVTIENNLIFISQGRGIEAICGGGWGKPSFVIRNNTVIFNNTLKTTEGRALSIDPRKGYGNYVIEKNVLAWSDGGGITYKFKADNVTLNENKFFMNRRGDVCLGGSAVANAGDFEDELEFSNEGNVHEMPGLIQKIHVGWIDRYSSREDPSIVAGEYVSEADLMATRAALGLKEYHIPGYDKTFASYKDLPSSRNNYSMSRYPFPFKKGDVLNWAKYVMHLIGAEGAFGVQPFEGKDVRVEAMDAEAAATGGPATVKMDVQFNSELLGKLEAKAKADGTNVKALIEAAVRKYLGE